MQDDFLKLSKEYQNWKLSNEQFFALATETIKANIERDKGALKAKEAFANMRKITEQLRQLITKKLEDRSIDEDRRTKLEDALLKVLQGDRNAYQAFVTHLEILSTSDVQQAGNLAKVFDQKFKEAKDLLIQGCTSAGQGLGISLKINFALMFQVWSSTSKKTIALHNANMEKNLLKKTEFDKAKSQYLSLQKTVKLLDESETERVDSQLTTMNTSIDDFTKVYNSVAVSCIVASILITLFFARTITVPLKKTVRLAKAIADGDFSATLNVRQKDEVGQVARARTTDS